MTRLLCFALAAALAVQRPCQAQEKNDPPKNEQELVRLRNETRKIEAQKAEMDALLAAAQKKAVDDAKLAAAQKKADEDAKLAAAREKAAEDAKLAQKKAEEDAKLAAAQKKAEEQFRTARIAAVKTSSGRLAFHPKGHILATSDRFVMTEFWSVPECKRLGWASGGVFAFSPSAKFVAVGGGINGGGESGLWSVDGKQLTDLGATRQVAAYAFSPDGKFLASGGFGKDVSVWSMTDGKLWTKFFPIGREDGGVYHLNFSPDGKMLATGDVSSAVNLWSFPGKGLLARLTLDDPLQRIFSAPQPFFSADGQYLVVTGWGKPLARVYSLRDLKVFRDIQFESSGQDPVFLPKEGILVGMDKSKIKIVAHSGDVLGTWEGYGDDTGFAASPNGRILAIWQRARFTGKGHMDPDDKSVKLCSILDGKLLGKLEGHTKAVREVAFSPDNRTVALGSDDHTVSLWTYEEIGKQGR